jgi:hypothetical protein
MTSSLLCELSHTLPPYACLKCEFLLCSLDLVACIIIALSCILLLVRLDLFARLWSASVILYLLLVRLDLFAALCHSALVTTYVCSVMVFISSVDVTFSWLVSTPVLR